MHESSNQHLIPMRGTIEHETRHSAKKAERIRAVLHGLADYVTAVPFPAMSDHYRAPEAVADVPAIVPGFNKMGDYVDRIE